MALSTQHNIFPDLSPRAEIFEKIHVLEKGWLEETELSVPEYLFTLVQGWHAKDYRFFHMKGIQADYDEQSSRLAATGIPLNLLGAAFNQFCPLFYIVLCRQGQISLYWGTRSGSAGTIAAILESTAGLSLYDEAIQSSELAIICKFNNCAALTGVPTSLQPKSSFLQQTTSRDTGMDLLISGMLRDNWAYIVQTSPVERRLTSSWLESCASEIKDIKEAFLSRNFQKSNRMAAHYTDLLEKTVKRLNTGIGQGFWQTGIYFLAGEAETVNRGASLLSSIFSGRKSTPEPIRTHICSRGAENSAFINYYNTEELKLFTALPGREYSGFRLEERIDFDVDFTSEGEDGPIDIGIMLNGDHLTGQKFSVPVQDLTRHGLVAGVTGSGKTNTIFNILLSLYKNFAIPFLVIEPAKSEYRELMTEVPDLLVFTLGDERPGKSAPFRLNPFAFPAGISLQTHIDFLKAVFHASFVMYAPMPYVLEECLYKIYEDKGWNLVTSNNIRGSGELSFPTLLDLQHKIEEVVDDLGYQDRTTMDIKAALKTRIKNLCLGGKGMMLNSARSVSFSKIMQQPVVLELKSLGNDEEKAFIMGLILMSIYEHYEALRRNNPEMGKGLSHLTVIEEAHRLLKNVPTEKGSEEQSNIKGMGVETFCNMLSEIRAYGEGVFVAEQIPTKLAPDVIKNSNLKIMHRLVAREDRETMGDAMNLDQRQQREILRLQTGRAACFREGMDRPVKITVSRVHSGGPQNTMGDVDVYNNMKSRFYRNHQSLLRKFYACDACAHIDGDCERIRREIEELAGLPHWREDRMRFFLPSLIDPEGAKPAELQAAIFHVGDDGRYCLSAHLIDDYVTSRGKFCKWGFEQIDALIKQSHKEINNFRFAATIGKYCQDTNSEGLFAVCRDYCGHRCIFGFEGKIMAEDPRLHNNLVDLLDTSEYGTRFYLELLTMIGEYLQHMVLDDHRKYMGNLGLCYLVQKLHSLRFSLPVQRRIISDFAAVVKKFSDTA